jgi:hypothetical protein
MFKYSIQYGFGDKEQVGEPLYTVKKINKDPKDPGFASTPTPGNLSKKEKSTFKVWEPPWFSSEVCNE